MLSTRSEIEKVVPSASLTRAVSDLGPESSTDTIDFITAMGHAHSTSTVSDNTITAAKLNDALAITNTPVRKHTNRIQTGFTLDSSDNAVLGGPITIDSGVSVVINGSLSIV